MAANVTPVVTSGKFTYIADLTSTGAAETTTVNLTNITASNLTVEELSLTPLEAGAAVGIFFIATEPAYNAGAGYWQVGVGTLNGANTNKARLLVRATHSIIL